MSQSTKQSKKNKKRDARKHATDKLDFDDCGNKDDCEPCRECDSCLVATLDAYARTVAKINQIYAETVLALGVLAPADLQARVLLLGVQRFNFIGRLQAAIDAFTECDNQECCELFARSIQLVTVSYYLALAAEVQALLPLPLQEDYLLLIEQAYNFIFDQIGCEPPGFPVLEASEVTVQKLALSEKEKSFWLKLMKLAIEETKKVQ